jgi:hypothetical protein
LAFFWFTNQRTWLNKETWLRTARTTWTPRRQLERQTALPMASTPLVIAPEAKSSSIKYLLHFGIETAVSLDEALARI